MSHPAPLLLTRRFLPMFLTQFFGAFNDNLYKYALLTLFSYGWLSTSLFSIDTLNNLAALLLVLPFFIFSATAGQLADRYETSQLIRYLKFFEICIITIASIGFVMGNIFILLFSLFLMGIQSAFFGPIKYSILPNLLKKDELVSGNAQFQSGTSLAILFGMIIGGIAISLSQGNVWWIIALLAVCAVSGFLACLFIPKQNIADPQLKVNWNFFVTSWQIIQLSRQSRLIFFILLANSWYWFYGATIMTQISQITRLQLLGNESVATLLLTLFSVGVVIGSAICKLKSKKQFPFYLIIYGAIGLTLCLLFLVWSLNHYMQNSPAHQLMQAQQYLNIGQILNFDMGAYPVFLAIILLGISGGLYIVPLYTLMQKYSPETQRARIIAANNIYNAIFMVCSAIFAIIILKYASLLILLLCTAVISALVCLFLLKQIKFYLSQAHVSTDAP